MCSLWQVLMLKFYTSSTTHKLRLVTSPGRRPEQGEFYWVVWPHVLANRQYGAISLKRFQELDSPPVASIRGHRFDLLVSTSGSSVLASISWSSTSVLRGLLWVLLWVFLRVFGLYAACNSAVGLSKCSCWQSGCRTMCGPSLTMSHHCKSTLGDRIVCVWSPSMWSQMNCIEQGRQNDAKFCKVDWRNLCVCGESREQL